MPNPRRYWLTVALVGGLYGGLRAVWLPQLDGWLTLGFGVLVGFSASWLEYERQRRAARRSGALSAPSPLEDAATRAYVDANLAAHTRPQGVRIIHADGSATPCELADAGVREDGLHEWRVLSTVDFTAGDRLEAEMIPERTSIIFTGIRPA